jgi:hypothetical protein
MCALIFAATKEALVLCRDLCLYVCAVDYTNTIL